MRWFYEVLFSFRYCPFCSVDYATLQETPVCANITEITVSLVVGLFIRAAQQENALFAALFAALYCQIGMYAPRKLRLVGAPQARACILIMIVGDSVLFV